MIKTILFIVMCTAILSAQRSNFKSKRMPEPPPQGTVTGKTVNAKVGIEVTGPIATVSLCGDQPFVVQDGGPVMYWEKISGWETGYLYGPQNREVYGRHTYMAAGTYPVKIIVDVMCQGIYAPYHDAAIGSATIIVQ